MKDTEIDDHWLPPRLENEPPRWYARFCTFCNGGLSRSLDETWRTATNSSKKQRAPGSWSRASKHWNWTERAADYDRLRCEQRARVMIEQEALELERRGKIIHKLGLKAENLLAEDTPGLLLAAAKLLQIYFGALDVPQDASHLPEPPAKLPKMIVEIRDSSGGAAVAPANPPKPRASGQDFYFSRA